MNIFEKLKPQLEKIPQRLKEEMHSGFPETLRQPILYFLDTPGKKIRPLLTLLSCKAVGGDEDTAYSAAAGVELFHDFTLIHDDIMDQDDLRRGRKTIHKKWDEGTAILVGDAMIGMAYAAILKSGSTHLVEVMQLFSEALIKVCEGQALDKEFESRPEVNLAQYMDMISKKTAWLIQLSCQIGAILGNGTPAQVSALSRFGFELGMGFQIQDDLLDFIADENLLGKKVGSDFAMDKKTYVSMKYREHITAHPELAAQYPGEIWKFKSIDQVKNAIAKLGLVAETRSVVDAYFQRALDALNEVLPLRDDNELYQITRFIQERQY